MNRSVLCLLVPLVVSACASPGFTTTSSGPRRAETSEVVVVVEADPGEVRAAQLRKQEKEIDELRDALDANRARAEAAARRSDAASRKALSAIEAMESQFAELRLRTDSAAAQADRSFALAKEFLSSIIAASAEQNATVQQNTTKFNRMDERLDATEGDILGARKLAQAELAAARSRSSTIEQTLKNTDLQLLALSEQMQLANRTRDGSRKQSHAELAAVRSRSSKMEQNLKTADQKLQTTDQRLKRTDQKLTEADQKLQATDQRLKRTDQKLTEADQKLQATDQRLKRTDQRLKRTDQKLLDLHAQLQQSNRNSERARKLSQTQMAATIARSVGMEQTLKGTDKQLSDMREQLLLVNRNIEDTRAAIGSGPMLEMMRRLESTQRETSGLRGLIEEMTQEQEVARKRLQDYYLDLDARIQDLQNRERAAREVAEARRRDAENAPMPPLQDVEIPATIDIDSGDGNGAEIRGEENTGATDAERSAGDVLEPPKQIEAMPLPEEKSPESSFDTRLSEPEAEMVSSSGEVTHGDVVEEADPEEML